MAVAFLTEAEDYHAAATTLGDSYFSPSYFLLCHALELALKSFILSSGGNVAEPKKLSHDLRKALARAQELGLSPNDSRVEQAIGWLAPFHQDMSFRYRQSGHKNLPALKELTEIVEALIAQIRPIVQHNFLRANR
jgi:hypothetical protein